MDKILEDIRVALNDDWSRAEQVKYVASNLRSNIEILTESCLDVPTSTIVGVIHKISVELCEMLNVDEEVGTG